MYDIEKKDDIPSTASLSKLGITAIGYTAGGIFLFLLQAFAKLRGLGLVAGAVVCVIGVVSLMSKDTADKKAGAIITTAGVLVLLSKIQPLAPLAGTLLSIGAIGLLATGIVNGIKFLFGLKKRS
ncbi:MAG: hypothetical protein LBI04_09100 [Treponema sp.]|jgi:hypothetical protein|nr:hypothetical protein [Treponema sp.]